MTDKNNLLIEKSENITLGLDRFSSLFDLISKIKRVLTEIENLDSTITEISKSSDMTELQKKQLTADAFGTAGKYGRTATDYLSGVRQMNRSGFHGTKGAGMAEQSLLAQSAGDMDSELADQYILTTNAAYKYNGETEKINAVLDGQSSITNRNNIALADMAAAMIKAGTAAAGYKVKIEDLSAMIGTMEFVTKPGGDEVGNAAVEILNNLQTISSGKITGTLAKANAPMSEKVNGSDKLRDPVSILRDLAKTYTRLDADDPLKTEILTNIGSENHADKLDSLLQNMNLYDKMLVDYSEVDGSAIEQSNKSAENLTGTINKLSNSWTEFVSNIVESDGLKSGVNLLNGLVEGLTSITTSGLDIKTAIPTIIGTIAQNKSKSGGLMKLISIINKAPFLATVEFSSDVYDSYFYV